MYVVIAGGGMVGGTLAERLAANGHEVIVIDQDKAICEEIFRHLDAQPINGEATDIDILEEAEITKADLAVGATASDADNLSFSMLAKNMGVPKVIVRMHNPKYAAAYDAAGVTQTLNIGELFVNQMVLNIEDPVLRQLATFGQGHASLVVVTIPENGAVCGLTINEVDHSDNFPADCVIAGIYREKESRFIFPRGNIELHSGDMVYLGAPTENISEAAEYLHKKR